MGLAERLFPHMLVPLLIVLTCAAKPVPEARTVSLTASDGTILKATYFAAAKPRTGIYAATPNATNSANHGTYSPNVSSHRE